MLFSKDSLTQGISLTRAEWKAILIMDAELKRCNAQVELDQQEIVRLMEIKITQEEIILNSEQQIANQEMINRALSDMNDQLGSRIEELEGQIRVVKLTRNILIGVAGGAVIYAGLRSLP